MGRMYVAKFKDVAVTAVQDLFEILAGANKSIYIHGWALSQRTEAGDAQEEQLLLTTNRGVGATSGTGGSSVTPTPNNVDDTASGATVEANNTTAMTAGGGSVTELEVFNWNVRTIFGWWYTPETRPFVKAGDRWTLELETAPADSISISGNVWFEEV